MHLFYIASRREFEFHVHNDASSLAGGVMLAKNPMGRYV